MEQIKLLIMNSIRSIEKTTELLYQQKNTEGYNSLDDTLKVLIQLVNDINESKKEGACIPVDESSLLNTLKETMKALEEKDTILLSDILEYELKEILLKLQEDMK